MISIRSFHLVLLTIVSLSTANGLHAWYYEPDWPPITEAELSEGYVPLDPGAPLEFLLRDLYIKEVGGRRISYNARIKVLNETGADLLQRFEVETWDSERIRRILIRITYPDGTAEELERNAFYEREVQRLGHFKRNRASVAIPRVTPGSIVEIRYEIAARWGSRNLQIFPRAPYPTRQFTFTMVFGMTWYSEGKITAHGIPPEAATEGRGSWTYVLHDLPVSIEEPLAPPRSVVEPWLLAYYSSEWYIPPGRGRADDYWESVARSIHSIGKDQITARDRLVRKKVEELTEGIPSDAVDDRLKALYEFTQKEIEDVWHPTSQYFGINLETIRMPLYPAETLKLGYGEPLDRLILFASMAAAADLEVKLAVCNDRSQLIFTPDLVTPLAVPQSLVLVRPEGGTDDDWRYCDLITHFLPYGTLNWWNQGVTVIPAQRRGETIFLTSPQSAAPENQQRRIARFTLDAEGNLKGVARFQFTGQEAVWWRSNLATATTVAEQDALFQELFAELFDDFTLKRWRVSHEDDWDAPLQFDFVIEIRDIATVVGSRLFLSPNVFQPDVAPLFTASERTHPILFDYPWQELDTIQIVLPESLRWVADNAAPGGAANFDQLRHHLAFYYDADQHMLSFERELTMGVPGFPPESYASIKTLFEEISDQDHTAIELQRSEN